ncbi:MAG: hypothetical protein KKA73_18825 [Chloroflexi bacterium]|nr:hypothetical protein [Chloroflexota bacterium]MBU1749743.1 hypothetical protein [Chloroflexota bacterium]
MSETAPASSDPDRIRQGYAWGLVLLVLGLTWGIPLLPEGLAGAAVGLILLGLNGARVLAGHPTSTVTVALGCIAVFVGLGAAAVDYADLYLPVPVVPLLLLGLGLALAGRAWARR